MDPNIMKPSNPGTQHLCDVLNKLSYDEKYGLEEIVVHDSEGSETFPMNQPEAAAEYSMDLDDTLCYQIGDIQLHVLYQGGYTRDTAEEIIYDYNEAAKPFMET